MPESSAAPAGSVATICTVRTCEPQYLAHTRERAAGSPASDEEIEPFAREVLEDLGAGGVAVISGIRGVLELARQEPAVLLCQLRRPFSPSRCRVRRPA